MMIIKKLEIENFGKLNKYSINFDKGVQIVYGDNEYGKSTIMAFIKMMFYGNMGKSLNASIRESRRPWNGGKMGGAIEFLHNGKLYRLQKQFDDRTPSKDKVELKNISDYEDIYLGKKVEIGELLFGLELGDFERSGYIGTVGSSAFEGGKSVRSTMFNLINTGNEDVSKEASEEHIAKAIKELKWKNGAGGKIIELENDILKLKEKIRKRKIDDLVQTEINNKICKLDKLIDEKNSLRWALEMKKNLYKIQKITELCALIDERNNLRDNIKVEGFGYQHCKEVLLECNKMKKEMDVAADDINELKKNLSNEYIDITKFNADKIKIYDKKKYNIKNILEELEKVILPESKNILDKHLSIKSKTQKIEKFTKDMNNINDYVNKYYKLKKEFQEYLAKDSEIQINIKNKRKEIEDGQKDLQFFKCNYKKLSIHKVLILGMSVAISSLFWFINNYRLYWIVSLNLTIFTISYFAYLLCFLYKKFKQKNFLQEKVDKQICELTLLSRKYDVEYGKKILEYENRIKELEIFNNNSQNLREKILKLENEIENESNFVKFYFSNFKIKIENIVSKSGIEIPVLPHFDDLNNIKSNVIKIIHTLKNHYEELDSKINIYLGEKNCKTMEQYVNKYNESLKKEGLLVLLENKSQNIEQIKIKFYRNICVYKGIKTFEDAVIKYNLLQEYVNQEEAKHNQINNGLNSLGIENEKQLDDILFKLTQNVQDIKIRVNCDKNSLPDSSIMEQRLSYLENEELERTRDQEKEKIQKFSETIIELEEILQNKMQLLHDSILYLKSLELAKAVIQDSYNELKNKIGPQINMRSSQIFKELTGGKYDCLYVQDDLGINIKSGCFTKNYNIFSSATIDQAYLSLRIALSEALSSRVSLPLLMDDVLMRYDDTRLKLALDYLCKYASLKEEGQIIIFTCHRPILQRGVSLKTKESSCID